MSRRPGVGLKHLLVCREYPPAAYPPGGIGTYVLQMAQLLARAGETVHVIGHRWDGAPRAREDSVEGRLIVHRVALDEPTPDPSALSASRHVAKVPRAMLVSSFPAQAFSWQAALLAENLIEHEGIDVIEAPEWEAPLYYLQLRRTLGLGPARRPPCVVHVHSPSERIFAANDWDTTVADYLPATSMEEYSIAAADATLCASRYIAEQALSRYGIARSSLNVIPYPLGDMPLIEREPAVWSSGSICHLGRLEPRKGVLELAEAAALISDEHPDFRVAFVGGDTPLDVTGGRSVGDAIRARASRRVHRRFRFPGSLDRGGVVVALSRAFAAVVPSRWDNLPYACIEAMASGLPVIVSPNGGMSELVEDGVSGWVAREASTDGLANALRRALRTPVADRERMGRAASETVRRVCDNAAILGRHLETKRLLVQCRAPRSIPIPYAPRRIGLVVTRATDPRLLDECLASVHAQTEPPAAVRIVRDDSRPGAALAAAEELAASDGTLVALVFIDSHARLEPAFLSICGARFAQDDRLGIVSAWTHEPGPSDRVRIQPCPMIPWAWNDSEITPYVAVRTQALAEALVASHPTPGEASLVSLLDRVARSGWSAVTYPAVLGSMDRSPDLPATPRGTARLSAMALAVQRPHTPLLQWLRACSPDARRAFVWRGFRNPLRSALRLAGRA